MKIKLQVLLWVFVGLLFQSGYAMAAMDEYELVIREHKFYPSKLTVPANKKVKIIVKNEDASAEEFESYELNREKVVAGNSKISIFVGPLKPGSYKFFGEFHQSTAQGTLEVQ